MLASKFFFHYRHLAKVCLVPNFSAPLSHHLKLIKIFGRLRRKQLNFLKRKLWCRLLQCYIHVVLLSVDSDGNGKMKFDQPENMYADTAADRQFGRGTVSNRVDVLLKTVRIFHSRG